MKDAYNVSNAVSEKPARIDPRNGQRTLSFAQTVISKERRNSVARSVKVFGLTLNQLVKWIKITSTK